MAVCSICKDSKNVQYNEKHDAYYCKLCDIWLEENCGDPNCEFCFGRPDKPSQVNEA